MLATGADAVNSLFAKNCVPTAAPVNLAPDTVLASILHPTTASTFAASKQVDGVWTMSSQQVELERAATHPLAIIVPGFRLKLLAGPSTGSRGYSHILSCSVPFKTCFKDILQRNIFTMQRTTCEDGMVYNISLGLDTRGLSVAAVQKATADLKCNVDALLHHESVVARALSLPALKTVEELATEADASKQQRAQAVGLVLTALSAGDDGTSMLDLQYGRAFGMRVDQQQCRALREGAVLGHGFEQTLLHATLAQGSTVAKIVQAAGADISNPVSVQRAVEAYVRTQGADAVAHGIYEEMQTIHNSRTTYGSDPSYSVGMSVTQATQNADGSLTLNVKPQLTLQSAAGEDQNLTPGTEYGDVLGFAFTNGLQIRDCEDGAHAISAVSDLFRCVPTKHILDSQMQLIEHMPADFRLLAPTLLFLSKYQSEHASAVATSSAAALAKTQASISQVNAKRVAALAETKPETARSVFATSLLAAAPQLTTTIGSSNDDPASKLQCSAKEYHAWWSTALGDPRSSLNGHSVAVSASLAPLLSTDVQDTSVHIHLLEPSLRVFESTAPARQIQQADTAAVKLDLTKAAVTPARRSLQQRLDQCGPLTLCMACNVRSSLHADETRTALAQHLQLQHAVQQTAANVNLTAPATPPGPSIVPMQAFSLRAEASTQEELSRQMAFSFYKTLLSCGAGAVVTLDKQGSAYTGMSMSRELPGTRALVVGSPIQGVELRNLHALGALQSCFLLTAAEALQHMPTLMPLALQQRMRMCQLRKQLVPLTPEELTQARHACGMLAQTALLPVDDTLQQNEFVARTASVDCAAQNMMALQSAASQVVGGEVHVTGGPFAETLMLTFA